MPNSDDNKTSSDLIRDFYLNLNNSNSSDQAVQTTTPAQFKILSQNRNESLNKLRDQYNEGNDEGTAALDMASGSQQMPFLRQIVNPMTQELSDDKVSPVAKIPAAILHGLMGGGMSPYSEASEAISNTGTVGKEIVSGVNKAMNLPFEAVNKGSELTDKFFNMMGIKLPTIGSPETDKKLGSIAREGITLYLMGKGHEAIKNHLESKYPEIKNIPKEEVPNENQNQETDSISPLKRDSSIEPTADQTKGGTPQGNGESLNQEKAPQTLKWIEPEKVPESETSPISGEPKEELTPKTTGLKNDITDLERESRSAEKIGKPETKNIDAAFEKAKASVDSGEVSPMGIVDEVNKKPRVISDDENLQVTYYKQKLNNAYDSISKKMFDATDKGEDTAQHKVRLAQIEDELNSIDTAAKKAGTEWGRAGRFRQEEIKDDYSLAAVKTKARVANDGKPLDEVTSKRFDELSRRLEETNNKLKEQDDKIAKLEAEKWRQKTIRDTALQTRKAGRARTKEELISERQLLQKKIYSKLGGQLNAMVPVEVIPDVARLAKNYLESGINTVEGIVDQVYNDLKDKIDGIDKRGIRDAISGYGRMAQHTIGESAKQFQQIKKQGKLVSELEDAKSGKLPEVQKRVRPTPSPEVERLQAVSARLKSLMDGEIRKIQRANRSGLEKGLDWSKSWYRNILLSGTNTIGKLTSYALQKTIILKPIDALESSVFNKVMPGISKKASIEGGTLPENMKALSKNYVNFVKQYFDGADNKELLRTGHGKLDEMYGRQGMFNTPEASAFFGHLHAILKQPTKRASFYYALEKQAGWYAKNGYDISDPTVQATMNTASYEYAMRDILLNDNVIVDAYKAATNVLSKRGTGGKVAATVAQIALPIVKVPTNFVMDTAGYLGGGGKAGAMIYKAIRNGIENLKPEDANTIMRLAKKQTIGLGLLALGYYYADNFGGYYQRGEKRKLNDLKPGAMKLFGMELPTWASHNPVFEVMQFGTTLRQLMDGRNGKAGDGVGTAILKTSKDLSSEIPFFNDQIIPSSNIMKMATDKVRSVIPPDIQKLARSEDMNAQSAHEGSDYFLTGRGEVQKRYPKGFKEEIELGIPGLRKNVSQYKSTGGRP
jgi:uncharacterized protein (DUF2164 family)